MGGSSHFCCKVTHIFFHDQIYFENTNKKYVLPTETEQLTLYTCQAQVLGTSTTRIGVLCDVVSKQFYVGEEAAE